MSLILLGILNSQVSGAAGGSYELIESNILTSNSTITFTSIPQDYKHLQLRYVAGTNSSSGSVFNQQMRLNGDSGSNYSYHRLYGNGSAASSQSGTSSSYIALNEGRSGGLDLDIPTAAVIDFLDYSNASKNTTVRALYGTVNTSEKDISLTSGLWMNTVAVTEISLIVACDAGSRFSLYGLR